MANLGQDMPTPTPPEKGYALSGKIMLSAIVVLFAVVVFMAGFHLYARLYLIRLRRSQLERRRQRRGGGRTHIVLYADNEQQRVPVTDHGLEPAVLNTLPVFLHSSKVEPPPECAVCLSEFEENEVVRLLPRCNHSFHIECINMWFHSHSTCPLCRSPVEPVVTRGKTVFSGTEEPIGNANGSETGSSSCSETRDTCQHEGGSESADTTSYRDRRKGLELVGVRIEVPRITELDDELTQIPTGFRSPGNRLLSLKRILSMSRKSPSSCGGGTTPRGVGSSGGTPVLDLESGPNELTQETSRVPTPKVMK